jgi:UDP-N-acetylmuramoyl-tripeptide--D-alanyl-D-alanine ligase
MGMNHAGEIAPLADLASPEVAIITNVGVAHIEFLGSREAIAREKGSLAARVGEQGTVVLSAEDEHTPLIASLTKARIMTAGIACGEIQAVDVLPLEGGSRFALLHEGERVEVMLGVPGHHMVRNAALAVAVGVAMGMTLSAAAEGLSGIQLSKGRMESRLLGGIQFFDDTYNANPDSTEAALVTLREIPGEGRRIAILGKMGELGDHASEGYRRVGTTAAAHADILIPVGQETEAIAKAAREAGLTRIHETESVQSAARMLSQLARPGDIVLVKGSRSAGMEAVFESF